MDQREIRRISAEHGLGYKFVSKDEKVTLLLKWISELEGLDIALKGGTAISRIHLKENFRFSEDIDLDMFGDITLDEKLDLLRGSLKDFTGFEIEGPRMLHLTARFDAYYTNEFGEKDRIRIDVYLPNSAPHSVKEIKPMLVQSPLVLKEPCIFPCYSLEDLVAQKLVALNNRMEGKDVYDLLFIMKKEIDMDLVLKALEKRLALRNDARTPIEFLRDLETRRSDFLKDRVMIMNNTNHYIPKKKRGDWRSFINTVFDEIDLLTR